MNISDIMLSVNKQFLEAEEKVVKEVLRNLLKREPTIEDAKDLTKFYMDGQFDKYHLAYKNLKLGNVHFNMALDGKNFGIEFIPCDTKDFLELATNEDGTKVTFK